jgi:hypothetical protein
MTNGYRQTTINVLCRILTTMTEREIGIHDCTRDVAGFYPGPKTVYPKLYRGLAAGRYWDITLN